MIPVKYGAGDNGFQSACILNAIAEDGSVSVSTTGTEIGQGLYTKVAQAVAYTKAIEASRELSPDQIEQQVFEATVNSLLPESNLRAATCSAGGDSLMATTVTVMSDDATMYDHPTVAIGP